jgi:decaprenylphospho-beta-D-ribofuranose 2-oxidase
LIQRARSEFITPWGLQPRIHTGIYRPENECDVVEVCSLRRGSVLARGSGTAYGDACVNSGGWHVSTKRLNKILEFSSITGRIVCQAGVTLGEIIQLVLPHGWFLPATPGTMRATVAGCFACDVHGKNHHVNGSFASHVLGLQIVLANGESRSCSPLLESDLFWATAGGLGQTGVITRLEIQMMQVSSAYIKSRCVVTRNLEETFECVEANDRSDYSVCWIDSLSTGKHLGRGVLMMGEHATQGEVVEQRLCDSDSQADFNSYHANLGIPFVAPRICSSPIVWQLFNAAYYKCHSRHAEERVIQLYPFFYPLDRVAHWNRIFGRKGFIEYQFAVPLKNAFGVCRQVLEALSNAKYGSFLAVLKKFGKANAGYLSFPIEGYTLAIDMRHEGVAQLDLLRRLDHVIADAGGRVYLVKDIRLDPNVLDAMYPKRQLWSEIVNGIDPTGVFSSSLVRRLGLRK